jgi:hypothetical protein
MARPRLWLLNFDADDELARPDGYTVRRAVLARFESLAERASGLVPPGDRVIDERASPARTAATGYVGRAFCPTPRAFRTWASFGAAAPTAPSLDVLRRVNHRRFCAELGQELPDARYVASSDELAQTLAARGAPWLLKRAFGFAGRGRLVVTPERLRESAGWIEPSLASGGEGLQVEPWVERTRDFALHGFLSASRKLTLGAPTSQEVDARGAWIASRPVHTGELSGAEESRLFAEAERTAAALGEAGYFGPFGIDAYTWVDERGAPRFNARSDVNARYSMGWGTGMGDRRPDLEDDQP